MASCDNTVLTGQEGLIQFKPLGTTNCIDDYCPFDRYADLSCLATLTTDVGDCLEVETVNISSGQRAKHVTGTAANVIAKMATPFMSSTDWQRCSRR